MTAAIVALTLAVPAIAAAQVWTVDSPDRRTVAALQRDDDGRVTVTSKDTIAVNMRGRGGFVVRLEPATGGSQ